MFVNNFQSLGKCAWCNKGDFGCSKQKSRVPLLGQCKQKEREFKFAERSPECLHFDDSYKQTL